MVSALLGLGGLFTCCCAFLSIPSSLLAVVTGHLSLIFMNRPNSGLAGKPAAAIGLISGYLGLLLSVGFMVMGLMAPEPDPNAGPAPSRHSNLNAAELKITSDNNGVAHGNTPAAIELAKTFSDRMKQVRDDNFTKGGKGISLTDGNFVTYCELRPGQCAFVVHVPEYRKFEDDAKDSLAELAWEAAQETVAGTMQKGDDLAVGMKGVLLYGAVMVGVVADPDDPEYGLESQSEEDSDLHPFFEPEDPEAAPEMNIELPAAEPAGDTKVQPEGADRPAEESKPADDSAVPADAAKSDGESSK